MKKNRAMFFAGVIAILIILIVLVILFYNPSSYKYNFEKESVLFVSNEASPIQLMREFNLNETVFVSPALSEMAPENSKISAAFNLVQVVFIGNDKNTVSLWRVLDKNGMLGSCRTNNGDTLKDIEVTVQECNRILEDKNNAIVLLSLPKAKGQKDSVIFSQNRIEIVPEKTDSLRYASFVFLKTMYDNAELIIKKTNNLTGLVK